MKKVCAVFLTLALTLALTGCGRQGELLDPSQPVTLSIWHYYNGGQKTAFDGLINEFNETVGAQKGIVLESSNYGSVTALEEGVAASINKEVGSAPLPDIVSVYADTAYIMYQKGLLADLSPYLTQEELDEYVASYIEEGRIGKPGELLIFPTAKSTEVFMLNATDWEPFAAACGVTMESLSTMEGVTETAKKYYEWTDGLTPDVPEDGKAFFGRDAMANLFIIASKQFGVELFQVENGAARIELDEAVMRKIWENYYVPYLNGYFGAFGRFRSDDAKVGSILALVGSSTSADYFPKEVTIGSESYPIQAAVMAAPLFEGGSKCAVQQGAGMVVVKSSEKAQYAASIFLKWFTQEDRNLQFSYTSGYLPVKKLKDQAAVNSVLESAGLSPLMLDTLKTSFATLEEYEMYTNKAFEGGVGARKVLEYSLSDKAQADRAQVKELIAGGMSRAEAVSGFTGEDQFQAWLKDLRDALTKAVAPANP